MITVNRRDFWMGLAGTAGLASAWAQTPAPVEGKDFQKINPPVAVTGSGKIEVVEFFWYGCPHCNALEPALNAWVRKLPADVAFHRVPVGFTPAHEFHQKIFYALEAMGQVEAMHAKVFAAIHVDRKRLDKEADVAALFTANGLDGAKGAELLKSFSVLGKARQAKQLTMAYHIDGVPTLGIQGRYLTSASMAGTPERAFAVADALIAQARKQPA
jgi:thiol:disulfide interchange protein DsbA